MAGYGPRRRVDQRPAGIQQHRRFGHLEAHALEVVDSLPGLSERMLTLDPANHYSISTTSVLRHLFDPLIDVTNDSKFVPALAETWRPVNNTTEASKSGYQAGARRGGRMSPTRIARRGSRGHSVCPSCAHAPAQYQRFTAQEVHDAFARYDRPDARFRFVMVATVSFLQLSYDPQNIFCAGKKPVRTPSSAAFRRPSTLAVYGRAATSA